MITNAMIDRRSIRKFKSDKVSSDIINELIEAARIAPSAKNLQPWHFIVMSNKHKDDFIMAMEQGLLDEEATHELFPSLPAGPSYAKVSLDIIKQAPTIIVVLNTNTNSPFEPIEPQKRVSEICDTLSIGAAIQNMLLKATELNIGSLWICNTFFAYKALERHLNTQHQITGIVAIGYSDEAPKARPRKNIDEIVEYRI